MDESGLPILAIQRLRMTTDGTGVTTLICSMGCPLRCRLCINPASWDKTVPGEILSVDELYERVKIDNLYFLTTNGGLTFGGGEPLLHSAFLKSFMEKYRETNWLFNLESSLNVSRKNLDDVIPYIHDFIIDTKDFNEERYKAYTGGEYGIFFENLMYLKEKVGPDRILLRIPVIPFLHKGNEAEENRAEFEKLGFTRFDVFPYVNPENRKPISEKAKENREILLKPAKEELAKEESAGEPAKEENTAK